MPRHKYPAVKQTVIYFKPGGKRMPAQIKAIVAGSNVDLKLADGTTVTNKARQTSRTQTGVWGTVRFK